MLGPRARRFARSAFMIAVFTGMVFALDRILASYSYADVAAGFRRVDLGAVAVAIGLLAAQYGLLVIREWLGLQYAGRRELGLRRAALASMIARPLSALGISTITGIGLRARIYGDWGLGTKDVALITAYDQLAYYVGIAAMCGVGLSVSQVAWPMAFPAWLPPTWVVGAAGTTIVLGYTVWCARRREPIRIRTVEVPVPDRLQLLGQVAFPVVDLALTAAIVHVILPADLALSYRELVGVCLLANLAGSLSQVPAGLGVFETVLLQFAPAATDTSALLGALLVRRTITNLLPMFVGGLLLFWVELRRRPADELHAWHNETIGTVLSVVTFAGGVILLVLGAEPGVKRALVPSAPGPVVLVVLGVAQLVIARGLQKRTIAAWRIAFALVLLRAVAEIVLGVRPAVIAVLVAEAGAFLAFRRAFTERGVALQAEVASWWAAIVMAVVATAGVAYFAEAHTLSRVTALQLVAAVLTLTVAGAVVGYRAAKGRRQSRAAAWKAAAIERGAVVTEGRRPPEPQPGPTPD